MSKTPISSFFHRVMAKTRLSLVQSLQPLRRADYKYTALATLDDEPETEPQLARASASELVDESPVTEQLLDDFVNGISSSNNTRPTATSATLTTSDDEGNADADANTNANTNTNTNTNANGSAPSTATPELDFAVLAAIVPQASDQEKHGCFHQPSAPLRAMPMIKEDADVELDLDAEARQMRRRARRLVPLELECFDEDDEEDDSEDEQDDQVEEEEDEDEQSLDDHAGDEEQDDEHDDKEQDQADDDEDVDGGVDSGDQADDDVSNGEDSLDVGEDFPEALLYYAHVGAETSEQVVAVGTPRLGDTIGHEAAATVAHVFAADATTSPSGVAVAAVVQQELSVQSTHERVALARAYPPNDSSLDCSDDSGSSVSTADSSLNSADSSHEHESSNRSTLRGVNEQVAPIRRHAVHPTEHERTYRDRLLSVRAKVDSFNEPLRRVTAARVRACPVLPMNDRVVRQANSALRARLELVRPATDSHNKPRVRALTRA